MGRGRHSRNISRLLVSWFACSNATIFRMKNSLSFTARVVPGSHRGKSLSVPTLNLDRARVPKELKEGIYACFAEFSGKKFPAAMHLGPRPVFQDSDSCEVHIIDAMISKPPKEVTMTVITKLRDIENFKTPEALMKAMQQDLTDARGILAWHEANA